MDEPVIPDAPDAPTTPNADKNRKLKEWRDARRAAGNCVTCGKPREPKMPGGATASDCALCAAKLRAYRKAHKKQLIAAKKCGTCGKPNRIPVGTRWQIPRGATKTNCADCIRKISGRARAKNEQTVAEGNCVACGEPRVPPPKKSIWERSPRPRVHGKPTRTLCAGCAAKSRVRHNERNRVLRRNRTDIFGPAPTGEPGYCGGAAKRLGASKFVRFGFNKDTLAAIDALKRRYKEAHPGESWRYHVSEILRDAIASVLQKGGPVRVQRERLCIPGWAFVLRLPLDMYRQIARIAADRFEGSRAAAVRVAIRQAVDPPFTGRVTLLRPRQYDPDWDD